MCASSFSGTIQALNCLHLCTCTIILSSVCYNYYFVFGKSSCCYGFRTLVARFEDPFLLFFFFKYLVLNFSLKLCKHRMCEPH